MLVKDVGQMLADNGLVKGATGWTLKLGKMPKDGDRVVALFETSGQAPEPTPSTVPQDPNSATPHDPTTWVTYPTLQVRVRGPKDGYEEARTKLRDIFRYLHARVGVEIGSCNYRHILAQSDPLPLGEDEVGRPELTQNFTTVIQETI
jgi:hypothetical protein